MLGRPFPDVPKRNSRTVEFPPGNSAYLYLIEGSGQIFRFVHDVSTSQRSRVLDLRSLFDVPTPDGHWGLMDMAFHPDFGNGNLEVFLSYTRNNGGTESVISRFRSIDVG